MDWEAIGKAFDMVHSGVVDRIDANDAPSWKVYRVGNVIRIDIQPKAD